MSTHEPWTVPPGMTISDGAGGAQKPVVVVGTPSDGDVPTYSVSSGHYVPAAPSGGGSGALTVLKKGTNYTLTAEDSGKLVVPTANDVVLTLPVAAAGLHYTIAPWTDWAHPVKVRPQADEQIAALGERTLTAGVGIIADGFNIGFNGMAPAGPLAIYATGAGEPWVVAGIAGAGNGVGWSSES